MSGERQDPPRLLSARPGADYVGSPHRAMRGEPEALGEAELERYVEDAHDRDDDRQQANASALKRAMLDTTRELGDRFRALRDDLHRPEALTSRSARNLARRIDRDLDRLAQELEQPPTGDSGSGVHRPI